MQEKRFGDRGIFTNAEIPGRALADVTMMSPNAGSLLEQAMSRLSLSARAYTRILKLARTIADLEGADEIAAVHITEAIQYRSLDRKADICG